jgi:membrane peptidoglycan carboxypeptidase
MRHRRRGKNRNSTGKRSLQLLSGVSVLLIAISILVPVSTAAAANAAYNYFTRDLPDPEQVQTVQDQAQTTTLYDRNGKVLYEVIDPTEGDRKWVGINDIAADLKCATVSIEDKTFYNNQGFDIRGLARAMIATLQGGNIQGGSSITQQIIKNSVIAPEERVRLSLDRKIKEILLSNEISRKYKKDQVLEWYLNTNFYGNLAYGIEAAAMVYFGKPARNLTLAEAAMLSAIPQFPKQNPIDRPNEAKIRQALVLDQMVEGTQLGVPNCSVSRQQADEAKKESLRIINRTARFNIKAPHFSVYARERATDLLADHLGIGQEAAQQLMNRGGLKIYTTLDLDLDNRIRTIANNQIAQLQNKKVNNASVVVIKPETGELLSMLGSLDYYNDGIDGKFNVATALRQPGSSFKPITYLELLRQGASPATLFWDTRTTFPSGGDAFYIPENYDRKYHGPSRMREALSRSYNIPAVDALQRAGIGNVLRTAHKLGITDLDRGLEFYGLALTLGGGEVKLLDLAYVYSVFANGGDMIGVPRPSSQRKPGFRELDPAVILRIEDVKGETLYTYSPAKNPRLLGPKSDQLIYLINSMLSDQNARAEAFGTNLLLANNRTAAVKTGTTNDNRDNWTMGYTPEYVVGVWVGNTDGTPMDSTLTGVTGAAPIWRDVMNTIHTGRPNVNFTRPGTLKSFGVCAIDGLRPNNACPVITELFIEGTEPKQTSTIVQKFPIRKDNGKIAVPGTPPEMVEEKLMYVFPSQAQDWINEWTDADRQRYLLAPNEYDNAYEGAPTSAEVAITYPINGSYVSTAISNSFVLAPAVPTSVNTQTVAMSGGAIDIRGSAKGGQWLSYRVTFARGWDAPSNQWQQIGSDSTSQIDNGSLARFDFTGLPSGLYALKLTRFEQDNRTTEAVVQFTLDLNPPTLKLAEPEFEKNAEWLDINVDVKDDFAISKVEFFANNGEKPIATKSVAPFSVKWVIPAGYNGDAQFWAIAYDAAGNRAESNKVTVKGVTRK